MAREERSALSIVLAFCVIAASVPASAKTASAQERVQLSVAMADAINDGHSAKSPFFSGAKSVEIGAATVDHPWALADWRSTDGKTHGQVLFRYLCDHWNVWSVTSTLTPAQLGHHGVPKSIATTMVADLSALEAQHFAYLGPARPGVTC